MRTNARVRQIDGGCPGTISKLRRHADIRQALIHFDNGATGWVPVALLVKSPC